MDHIRKSDTTSYLILFNLIQLASNWNSKSYSIFCTGKSDLVTQNKIISVNKNGPKASFSTTIVQYKNSSKNWLIDQIGKMA